MRMMFALPLLALAACQVTEDDQNDQVTVQYNQKRYFSKLWGAEDIPVRARAVARGRWERVTNAVMVLDRSAYKVEKPKLIFASDDRRHEPLTTPATDREQSNRRYGLALALERERPDGLGCDGVSHETISALSNQDFPWPCRLLQPRGDVHGIARRERVSAQ